MLSHPTPVYVLAGTVRREDLTRMAERRRLAAQLAEDDPPRGGVIFAGRRAAGRMVIAVGEWIGGAAPVDATPQRNTTG